MASQTPLLDPARSRALLIGVGTYHPQAGLHDLPSVPAGVEELARLLTDPARGGLSKPSCVVMIDPDAPDQVDLEIGRAADEAEDTLLVFYSGHGVPDPYDGGLHLALPRTDRRRVHSTAVPISWVRSALVRSHARTRIVILDCCFSGRAIEVMSGSQLSAEVDVAGSFVMTASDPNVQAIAPEGERFTAFTGELIRVLRDGVPEAGEFLDLDTIFRQVRRGLRERGFPEPGAQRIRDAASLALARNPARKAPSARATASARVSLVPVNRRLDEVVNRLTGIEQQLDGLFSPDGGGPAARRSRPPLPDGVACFNGMYLRVTEEVRDALPSFENPEFIERLEVLFAEFYLQTYAAAAAAEWMSKPWAPLFARRAERGIVPLQFALAGMHAHIHGDLADALVLTWKELGLSPARDSHEYRDYERVSAIHVFVDSELAGPLGVEVIGDTDTRLGDLDDYLALWKVREAREAAWRRAAQRLEMPDHVLDPSFDEHVQLTGTMLLQPFTAGG